MRALVGGVAGCATTSVARSFGVRAIRALGALMPPAPASETLLVHAVTRSVALLPAEETRLRHFLVDAVARIVSNATAVPASHRRILFFEITANRAFAARTPARTVTSLREGRAWNLGRMTPGTTAFALTFSSGTAASALPVSSGVAVIAALIRFQRISGKSVRLGSPLVIRNTCSLLPIHAPVH